MLLSEKVFHPQSKNDKVSPAKSRIFLGIFRAAWCIHLQPSTDQTGQTGSDFAKGMTDKSGTVRKVK